MSNISKALEVIEKNKKPTNQDYIDLKSHIDHPGGLYIEILPKKAWIACKRCDTVIHIENKYT